MSSAPSRCARRALAALTVITSGALVLACTDGKTPDCSDASAGCGPLAVDAQADASMTLPEASTTDATSTDASDAQSSDAAETGDVDATDDGGM